MKWWHIFGVAALVLALILGYIQSTLKYSILFYMPGFLGWLLLPLAPCEQIEWKVSTPRTNTNKPNIVLIIADDLGANDLFGGMEVDTPFIKSIATGGVTFASAYAGHATCCPSRAAIMTGRYGARFGFELTAVPTVMSKFIGRFHPANATLTPHFNSHVESSLPDFTEMIVPKEEQMISSLLSASGEYDTAYIGKWHLGESDGARPQDRGFHDTLSFLKGASLYAPLDDPDVITMPVGDVHDDFLLYNLHNILRFNNKTRFKVPKYMTDYLAEEAARAINAKKGAPFFLTVAFNAPHTPLQAKRSDYDALSHIKDPKRRVYAGMIKALDEGVGKVLAAIDDNGLRDNTLVIFTSDNGSPYYVGVGNNLPYRGGKYTFFEGGVRIPMFMRWPAVISAGVTHEEPVNHVDIFMTIAAAAGIDIEALRRNKIYDGVDLVRYLASEHRNGGAAPSKDKSTNSNSEGVQERQQSESSPAHNNFIWRAGHYHSLLHNNALTQSRFKLSVSERPDRMLLFDLTSDPTEQQNLLPRTIRWTKLRPLVQVHEQGQSKEDSDQKCLESDPCIDFVLSHLGEGASGKFTALMKVITSKCPNFTVGSAPAAAVCALASELSSVNNTLSAPLWPPLLEYPIGIDVVGPDPPVTEEDDYVYWAN